MGPVRLFIYCYQSSPCLEVSNRMTLEQKVILFSGKGQKMSLLELCLRHLANLGQISLNFNLLLIYTVRLCIFSDKYLMVIYRVALEQK